MIPTKPVDIALDSLLRVSGTAFVFSLLSHLFHLPHFAFVAGALSLATCLALLWVAKVAPNLRAFIVYRVIQLVAGITLGVLA